MRNLAAYIRERLFAKSNPVEYASMDIGLPTEQDLQDASNSPMKVIKINDELHARLKEFSKRNQRLMQGVVATAIREYLDRQRKEA